MSYYGGPILDDENILISVEVPWFSCVIVLMILIIMGYISSIFYFGVFLSFISVLDLTVPLRV